MSDAYTPKLFMVVRNGTITRRITSVTQRKVRFDQADQFGIHGCCEQTIGAWHRWVKSGDGATVIYAAPDGLEGVEL